jgi:hypothetical protein
MSSAQETFFGQHSKWLAFACRLNIIHVNFKNGNEICFIYSWSGGARSAVSVACGLDSQSLLEYYIFRLLLAGNISKNLGAILQSAA